MVNLAVVMIKNELKIGDLIKNDPSDFKFAEIIIDKRFSGNRHFGPGLYYDHKNGDKIIKIIGPIKSKRELNTLLKDFYEEDNY